MSIRDELASVRAEYSAMHTYDLIQALVSFGVPEDEVLAQTRDELIEALMAKEEYAAFS